MNYQIITFFIMLLAYGLIRDLIEQYFENYNPENFVASISNNVQSNAIKLYSNHSISTFTYYLSNLSAAITGIFGIILGFKIPVRF